MKLYAQLGFGDGGKTAQALAEGLVDGVILSPRDMLPAKVGEKIAEFQASRQSADILLDPQFYATLIAGEDSGQPGKLLDWPHFKTLRKSDLEESSVVTGMLRAAMTTAVGIPTTAIIAPNVYVSRSFDSREGVIAKHFIRHARGVYDEFKDSRPLYATLCVCREALLDREEFEEFLNDITRQKHPPDGFYVLVGSRGSEAFTDIMHADVIARWMLLNHSLSINGFEVINGFSDILTPFLGMAGATAGASGWWSNLRLFSLDRFAAKPGMARRPIPRYLSLELLNRITFTEREALAVLYPSVINGLPHDADYNPEPSRTEEALQTWESLKELSSRLISENMHDSLRRGDAAINQAESAYAAIAQRRVTLDKKSNADHLPALREALRAFKGLAGLE